MFFLLISYFSFIYYNIDYMIFYHVNYINYNFKITSKKADYIEFNNFYTIDHCVMKIAQLIFRNDSPCNLKSRTSFSRSCCCKSRKEKMKSLVILNYDNTTH